MSIGNILLVELRPQQDAYELRYEHRSRLCRHSNRLILLQRKAGRVAAFAASATPGCDDAPAVSAQGCNRGAMRVQEISKELAGVADERPRGTAPHDATHIKDPV